MDYKKLKADLVEEYNKNLTSLNALNQQYKMIEAKNIEIKGKLQLVEDILKEDKPVKK